MRFAAALIGMGVVAWSSAALSLGALDDNGHTPIEQRVALAVGPERTTVWTQLRTETQGGQIAIVMPAEPGAALDWSSPAWMEALELASAPRIFPPDGVLPACPGESPTDVAIVAGQQFHESPLQPLELVVHADADALLAWASVHGLTVSDTLATSLATLAPLRFVAARFNAPMGLATTPTLRITGATATTQLPFVLTEAGASDVLVTLFSLAPGGVVLDGTAIDVPLTALSYDVAAVQSNYAALRITALAAAGPNAHVLETASRALLLEGTTLTHMYGDHDVAGLTAGYFTRAGIYDAVDPQPCTDAAIASLEASGTVGASCARADLGFVDGGMCTEAVAMGEIDPDGLRCGVADDLAVALSGQVAIDARLTRHSLRVGANTQGVDRTFSLGTPAENIPLLTAATVDLSGCDGGGGASSSNASAAASTTGSSASSSGAGGGGRVRVPVYEIDTSCGAAEIGALLAYETYDVDEDEDAPIAVYREEEDCSGDTSSSATRETSDEYVANLEDDGCSGDTSSSTSSSSETDDEGCSGDTSSSSSSDDDDYWDETTTTSETTIDYGARDADGRKSSCSIGRRKPRRKRLPRLSVMTLMTAFGMFSMRRLRRKRT